MRSVSFVVPGSLASRSGGYEYDRRIVEGLRARGWSVRVHEIPGSFPAADAKAIAEASRALSTVPDATVVVVDGLAFGAIAEGVERESSRLRFVALVHMPLTADATLDPVIRERLERDERRTLAASAAAVVTGRRTVDTLIGYGLARDRIAVIEPGTIRVPPARGSSGERIHLLSVGAVTRGKGHDVLLRALASVRQRNWRLTCAGSVDRDRAFAEQVRAIVMRAGLEEHVTLAGELDDAALSVLYDEADVFVLATLHETYGMAVAEGLARGLPVVSTTVGAIPDLVGEEAGLLAPPGDEASLAAALTQVLDDRALRERLAMGARRVRDRLPAWDAVVDRMIEVLMRVAANERIAF